MIIREELLKQANKDIQNAVLTFHYGVGRHFKIQMWKGMNDPLYGELVQKGEAAMFTVQQTNGTVHLSMNNQLNPVVDYVMEQFPEMEIIKVPNGRYDILVVKKKAVKVKAPKKAEVKVEVIEEKAIEPMEYIEQPNDEKAL